MDSEQLLLLVTREMPFGKYQGRLIADLPGNYLNWFARKGFPPGELGRLLALMHELDHNGLSHLLTPLRTPMIANACGVDFGTSNSTVAWIRPGQPALLALEGEHRGLPSAIFFHDEDQEVSYGRAALADYLAGYDGRLMRAMKSLLGSSLIDSSTEVQGRMMPLRVMLTRFIAELKQRAERDAGRSFTSAVFGRPVYFVDDSPAADKLAQDTLGEIAAEVGFTDVQFQFEPLAAAFDYESGLSKEELVLVIDIGGGTSDFTLIRLGPTRAGKLERQDDILAHGGVHIGGADFDKQFSLAQVMPLLGLGGTLRSGKDIPSTQYVNLASWHTINQIYSKKALEHLSYIRAESLDRDRIDLLLNLVKQREGHWLAMQVEDAKIALSHDETKDMDLARIEQGKSLAITRADFDAAVEGLVVKVETTVAGLLTQSGLGADAIDTVFFTGGSSRVPLLRQRVSALTPRAHCVEGDLFGSIGTGLALDAARRFG